MYEVDILEKNNWKLVIQDKDIKVIDNSLKELKITHPNNEVRVLENDSVLVFLHGLERDYNYWSENYVKENENSIYQKIKKTRKKN